MKHMKSTMVLNIGGALMAALLIAPFGEAQTQKNIGDQDLLNMLATVDDASSNETATASPIAVASDDAAVVVEDADTAVDTLDMAEYDESAASTSGNFISVRLNKVGLEDAINLFAQLSGANIIVPELTEAAQISVNLKDVEWRPALQSILDTYNYELYQRVSGSNVWIVRRRPAGAPVPQVVETFVLKYATVANVATLIRQLLPEDAKISEFASRNMIVVKSTESSLGEVRAVLESIDKVREQVYIESKFMELSDDAQKDLGIDWKVLTGYGATLSTSAASYGKETSTDQPSENVWKDLVDGSATAAGSGEYALMTSVLNADDFRLVLSAMENNKGVNIVSNPKVIVANEEPANISIIRQEPNLRQSRQQALNDTEDTITYELDPEKPFFEYGIKLDVTPSINTSSNITVKINPMLTRKFGEKRDRTQANDLLSYPIIDVKSVETVFNLANGQTAAIGGLTEATQSEDEYKIPFLGDIPLLGRLFSWKQTVNGQSETIIFVTVGLANTHELDNVDGLPDDAELVRRKVIKDKNGRIMRDQEREYFQVEDADNRDDVLKVMKQKEDERVERRDLALQKQAK